MHIIKKKKKKDTDRNKIGEKDESFYSFRDWCFTLHISLSQFTG